MEKVLIIGKGFLGTSILKELKNHGVKVIGTHLNSKDNETVSVDVRNTNSINNCVTKIKPDLIINCAASTNIDFLENNPETAFLVNSEGAKNVALVAQANKIRLIHISTDSVFDGTKGTYSEEDLPNPINIYAKSKVQGEQLVKENSENHVIIRTNFYGVDTNKKFLFSWILNTLRNNKNLIGFSDVFFTPLEVTNLSNMIHDLCLVNYTGTIHLASDEILSKYEFALRVADAFSLDKNLIKEGSIDDDTNLVAKRPKNTSLSNKLAKKLLKTQIISLGDWLNKIKNQI